MHTNYIVILLIIIILLLYMLYDKQRHITKPVISPNMKTIILDIDETLLHYDGSNVIYRPHLIEFMKQIDKLFDEIVIFTAATKEYADLVVDEVISMSNIRPITRRFYRDSCMFSEYGVIKDIRNINVNLRTTIFIDNTPSVFYFTPENGLHIKDFRGNLDDLELIHILEKIREITRKWQL